MQNETPRILANIKELLTHGLFPGAASDAVSEAKQFIEQLTAGVKERNEHHKETGSSDGREASAGRVGDGGVSHPGRKDRKRKANPA